MKKTLQTLTFAAVMALTLLTSSTVAFAKDAKLRETAWTDLGDLLDPITVVEEFLSEGVTWEE